MKQKSGTRQGPTICGAFARLHNDLLTIDERQIWVDPDEPLITVEKMILVLEDRRFFLHNGVDVRACIRELLRALAMQSHGGASTIDMQFVRTATGFRDKTLRRKLYEMFLAIFIQFKYSKLEIFRSYLSCAYFGSRLYGLESVSREVYKKRPKELAFDEAAEIAAMLVYPRPLVPMPGWQEKIDRRTKYLKRRYQKFEKRFDKLQRYFKKL